MTTPGEPQSEMKKMLAWYQSQSLQSIVFFAVALPLFSGIMLFLGGHPILGVLCAIAGLSLSYNLLMAEYRRHNG